MSHVLPITWHLIISLCFSTQNWFLIFPASIGNTLRNPPLYLDGRVKHHIEGRSDRDQVWSLTQFYSVDFSQSRISVKKCVFNKHTIKVCISCCWQCPGTSVPSPANLTVSLYLCSSGSNARGELRALEGHRVSFFRAFSSIWNVRVFLPAAKGVGLRLL